MNRPFPLAIRPDDPELTDPGADQLPVLMRELERQDPEAEIG